LVLAGVNGAGKSSVGGHLLRQAGVTWFNPDAFARELTSAAGCDQETANALAWDDGLRRLDEAIANGRSYAFETTLGGRTIAARLLAAARTRTHDVLVWFCGLTSPELHIARVRLRVAGGGHDIPEPTVRARYRSARRNLIRLMPHLAHLKVYDNSASVMPGEAVPDPMLILEMKDGTLVWPAPGDLETLRQTPDWAKPLMEAALARSSERGSP
jgi:predicted ABC-type ATPase